MSLFLSGGDGTKCVSVLWLQKKFDTNHIVSLTASYFPRFVLPKRRIVYTYTTSLNNAQTEVIKDAFKQLRNGFNIIIIITMFIEQLQSTLKSTYQCDLCVMPIAQCPLSNVHGARWYDGLLSSLAICDVASKWFTSVPRVPVKVT